MSTQGPERAPQAPPLTSLPRVEDLPVSAEGYDQDSVRRAFDAFRRHAVQLQAQLRVLQAAGRTAQAEPSGHALRMDALHLIRAAAEFADTLERDAQNASAAQFARAESELSRRQRELQQQESEIEAFRRESERQRAEILNAARNEARELIANAHREAGQEVRDAEARAARLLEQARHQATELTNAARAEVDQTLEWARAQATAVSERARQGAEQLLSAAGLGSEAMERVVEAIVGAAEAATQSVRVPAPPARIDDASGSPGPASTAAPGAEPAPPAAAEPQPPGPTPPSAAPGSSGDER